MTEFLFFLNLFVYRSIDRQNPQLVQIFLFVIEAADQPDDTFPIDGRNTEHIIVSVQFLQVVNHLAVCPQVRVRGFDRC